MHEDAEQLVRFDLAQTARRAGLACTALVIEIASEPRHWLAVAADFRRARTVVSSHVPGLYAALEAAEALSRGQVGRALACLADGCYMHVEGWVELTRGERAEAQS